MQIFDLEYLHFFLNNSSLFKRVTFSIDFAKIFQSFYRFLNNHQLSMYLFLKNIDCSEHNLEFQLFPLHFNRLFMYFFIYLINQIIVHQKSKYSFCSNLYFYSNFAFANYSLDENLIILVNILRLTHLNYLQLDFQLYK